MASKTIIIPDVERSVFREDDVGFSVELLITKRARRSRANRQNKRLSHRGRSLTRGTEVAAKGGKEVAAEPCSASASEPKVPRGELHRSFDVGELVGNSDPAEQRRLVLM